jgi:hypothetical protein
MKKKNKKYQTVGTFPKSNSKISERDRGLSDRDRMVVGFTTTYAISAYHH